MLGRFLLRSQKCSWAMILLIFLFNCLIRHFYMFLNCSAVHKDTWIYWIKGCRCRGSWWNLLRCRKSFAPKWTNTMIPIKCTKSAVPDSYKIPHSSVPAILRNFLISAMWFLLLLIFKANPNFPTKTKTKRVLVFVFVKTPPLTVTKKRKRIVVNDSLKIFPTDRSLRFVETKRRTDRVPL